MPRGAAVVAVPGATAGAAAGSATVAGSAAVAAAVAAAAAAAEPSLGLGAVQTGWVVRGWEEDAVNVYGYSGTLRADSQVRAGVARPWRRMR